MRILDSLTKTNKISLGFGRNDTNLDSEYHNTHRLLVSASKYEYMLSISHLKGE